MSPIILDGTTGPGRTLKSMRDEVLANSFDSATYGSLVDLWLNEAQGRVLRGLSLHDAERTDVISLTAGTAEYELPDEITVLTAVVDDQGEIKPTGTDDMPVDGATGKPYAYSLYGSSITFYPTPKEAADLTIRYRASEGDMVSDTDTATIPDDFCHLLVTYALYKAYRKEDDLAMAQSYWQEFNRDLREAKANLQYRDASRTRRIGGLWAYKSRVPYQRP
jgi:hypothetical protein